MAQDPLAFVAAARAKGISDEHIRELMLSAGWSEAQAAAALAGLEVPVAAGAQPNVVAAGQSSGGAPLAGGAPVVAGSMPATPPPAQIPAATPVEHKSISALEAALQHVLLWVFTGTSTVMISIVSAALFGGGDGSSKSLLTYLVMETITFLPFYALFIHYLRQLRREQELATGKVWSIITIVLHSLGFISALITFLLVIILVHNTDTTPALAAAAAIGVMNALVVAAYVLANFAKRVNRPLRLRLLRLFPILLIVLISIFGILALVRVGPLKADDQTRQNLVDTTKAIHDYTRDNKELPSETAARDLVKSGVSYRIISSRTYELCANFNHDSGKGYDTDYRTYSVTDSYVSSYDFDRVDKGKNCFKMRSAALEETSPKVPLNSEEYCPADMNGTQGVCVD